MLLPRHEALRTALDGVAGGVLAGALVLGVGGRLVMRGIALMAGGPPSFELAGSLEVVALGAIIGAQAGLVYGLAAPHLPGRWWVQGIAYGLLAYGAVLAWPLDGKGAARAFPALLPAVLMLFGVAFILFGLALAAWMRRRGRLRESRRALS